MNSEDILQTYTLEELMELNDLSEADVLDFLLEAGLIQLPDPAPL